MTDRHDVHPHHLLRAVLADADVRLVLASLGADADDLRLTLDHLWLAASDTIDVEEVSALGIELGTVLAVLNPPHDAPPDWGGRRFATTTRDVLVAALANRALQRDARTSGPDVLVALAGSKDRLVAGTFAAHGLRARDVRRHVERWGRRR
ncbi:hypothetical protein GCM10023340_11990 [Nocardioides marinquilinus]|uniref:Clp amino terminal domain-containing protein, pathogenicity island component n=1 Tax=Nocardioides marinquilinus TaxID=1210400 RepID=A0ABP9PCD1_9ACTN